MIGNKKFKKKVNGTGLSKLNALKEFSIATMRVTHYTPVGLIIIKLSR